MRISISGCAARSSTPIQATARLTAAVISPMTEKEPHPQDGASLTARSSATT
jgi:hypothetical protein